LSSLYIGPNSGIDKFEIDIFVLQIILSVSDIIAYPIACFFIATAKRKQIGLKCFLISGVCNFIAGLITSSPGCTTCVNDIAKLVLIFSARYCVSYYYGVLFIYVIEIYPEQIRTIGFGTVSAVGAVGGLAVQKVLDFTSRNGH
jgi:MFS family permease